MAASTQLSSAEVRRSMPPGPRGMPVLGSVLDVWRDPLGFLLRGAREHGDVVTFRFGHYRYVLVNEPEAIRHVLIDNAKSYLKSRNYDALRLVLGNGLVTSEGEFWRRQRKLTQPGFHRHRLASFATTMAECTDAMAARWTAHFTPSGQPIDLHAEMMALTLRIVGRTLFSTDLAGEAAAIGEAISVGLRHANDYAESVIRVPPWIPTPNNLRFKQAVRVLDGMVLKIIDERRKSGREGDDLLGMLMAARDDESKGMTDQQLRDEVMTLVLAGHETTASALAWTFDLLSRHPDVDRRVAEEARALGDRPITIEDLPRLTYTSWVVQEAMRLYPPVWVFERQAIADDVVAGYAIPKGTIVAVSPWALHRNPRYWENPEGFDPERFRPDEVEKRPRCAYLPFATGPRQCIGNAFALMEAQIVLATVARKWRLSLIPGGNAVPDPKVTLRPRDGLQMTLAPR
jgi:cytochrome P450